MNKNEWQFKNLVRRLKIDDEPNQTHRSDLRREMLAEFDSPGQPAVRSTGFMTGLHRLKLWHVAALASAAIIIIAVLISSGVFTGPERQPDGPIVHHPDSQTPKGPQIGDNGTQPPYPEKLSPGGPAEATLAMKAELEEINRLYAAGDIGGLIAMLDTSSQPAKIRAAQFLARIGDLGAIESLARLSSTLGADMPNDPFAAAIEAIKERLGREAETAVIADETANKTQIPPETEPHHRKDAPQLEADADNEQPGFFGIKVINAKTNQPIEGAELDIRITGKSTQPATNDAAGAIVVTATRIDPKTPTPIPPPGTWLSNAVTNSFGRYNIDLGENTITTSLTVKIKKDAFVPKRLWYRPEDRGIEIPKNYTLKLEPGTIVGGFVRKKDDNTPVANATVKISIHDALDEDIEIADVRDISCQTDAEGRWQCDVIPEKVFEIYAQPEHPDYVSTEKHRTNLSIQALRAGQAVLYMRAGLNVTGTVSTLDGDPIKGATIYQGESRYSSEPKTKTDADGRFRFDKCTAGEMTLTVKAKGFTQDMKVINVNDQLEDVRFNLPPGNSVTVRIVDINGSGIRGV
ncbi:MAG: carboxypeptidase regulatory-like domain-containing protein [Planctomycetes bacterium]|nr:carboxypeptidase regulatory-like domain-containing protein [Planctomycetota bacterium]